MGERKKPSSCQLGFQALRQQASGYLRDIGSSKQTLGKPRQNQTRPDSGNRTETGKNLEQLLYIKTTTATRTIQQQ